jgi:tripartite-type tricarboxylate transporter receptor subunit TctC
VGYPAGGSTDIVARLIGDWLGKRLGQQFIVENHPGAGNNLATEAVAKAAPEPCARAGTCAGRVPPRTLDAG